jgi:hypothetical protein
MQTGTVRSGSYSSDWPGPMAVASMCRRLLRDRMPFRRPKNAHTLGLVRSKGASATSHYRNWSSACRLHNRPRGAIDHTTPKRPAAGSEDCPQLLGHPGRLWQSMRIKPKERRVRATGATRFYRLVSTCPRGKMCSERPSSPLTFALDCHLIIPMVRLYLEHS